VRVDGDTALLDFTKRFDGCSLSADELRVSDEEIQTAESDISRELLDALHFAAERIRRFQSETLPQAPTPLKVDGRTLQMRYTPVDSAGIYVPGGTASLASSVLMNAIPASVAGVEHIVMVTPPAEDGGVSPDRLAAAKIAGVDEVYRAGGAQAVAALAYGTETIPAVDMIAGPGNIYVALAKAIVFGQVGIDMIGGPSEVLIIADDSARPAWVAADMIAQAEHNPGSAVLLTPSKQLANSVNEHLENQLQDLPKGDAARDCLKNYGAVMRVESMDECIRLANELATEHLEIITENAECVRDRIRHAGAIFVGPFTPVPVGDYVAGPSHVLPTGATARFSSGLSAVDFLKRSSVISYDRGSLRDDASRLCTLAETEGLHGHSRSVKMRLDGREEA
jgi:histidinol dehydrogenase